MLFRSLTTNSFVHVIALDFPKAFDSIRHCALLEKMSSLPMPDYVFNWLIDYFAGHSQCTKYAGTISPLQEISAGVIQGSAIGPASFLVCASDLNTLFSGNRMHKYADDTYLVIPASNSHTLSSELNNVEKWAAKNNLKLNTEKTQEMIVFSNNKHKLPSPPPIKDILRVEHMIVLGVKITNTLKVSDHVADKIKSGSMSLFALKTLKAHGMPKAELHAVFRSTTLSSTLYAAPAWWGLTSAEDKTRLESFLRKCSKCGFYDGATHTVSQIVAMAETTLFKAILNEPYHVLKPLLPPKTKHQYSLRPRAHSLTIPARTTSLNDRQFLTRMLYLNCC